MSPRPIRSAVPFVLTLALPVAAPASPAAAQSGAADSVRTLVDAGHRVAAFDYAREAAADAAEPDGRLALALGAMAVERFDLAVRAADSAMVLAPERSRVQLVYGQAYLSHARSRPGFGAIGKVKAGRAALERAIELDPDNLEARHTLMQFLLQAPGIVGGSRDGARRQAQEIARRDRVRGLLALLEVAAAGDDLAELEAVFADAVPLMGTPADSGSALMGAFLVAAAAQRDREVREALTHRVYTARPEHPVAAYHRARLWVIQGERLDDAERLLQGYLAGPELRAGVASRAGAYWRLGQLYDELDRKTYATEQYRQAERLDPRLKAGKRLSSRMEAEL